VLSLTFDTLRGPLTSRNSSSQLSQEGTIQSIIQRIMRKIETLHPFRNQCVNPRLWIQGSRNGLDDDGTLLKRTHSLGGLDGIGRPWRRVKRGWLLEVNNGIGQVEERPCLACESVAGVEDDGGVWRGNVVVRILRDGGSVGHGKLIDGRVNGVVIEVIEENAFDRDVNTRTVPPASIKIDFVRDVGDGFAAIQRVDVPDKHGIRVTVQLSDAALILCSGDVAGCPWARDGTRGIGGARARVWVDDDLPVYVWITGNGIEEGLPCVCWRRCWVDVEWDKNEDA